MLPVIVIALAVLTGLVINPRGSILAVISTVGYFFVMRSASGGDRGYGDCYHATHFALSAVGVFLGTLLVYMVLDTMSPPPTATRRVFGIFTAMSFMALGLFVAMLALAWASCPD